jgi:uracil-DNA glycosylase
MRDYYDARAAEYDDWWLGTGLFTDRDRPGWAGEVAKLQADCRDCRACVAAGFQVESWSVFEGRPGQRAYLLGQAPGIVEVDERRPWRGRAGKQLRRWLGVDEEAFYATFYCASVTRCYPGRVPGGRGDRAPSPPERDLCARWRDDELRLLQPRLVLPVGGLAIQALLDTTRLTEAIGERFERNGTVVVPLPHPSGASSWPHQPGNRERLDRALATIREELRQLGR